MDRQLFYEKHDENGHSILEALSPVIRLALTEYQSTEIKQALENVIETILADTSDFPNRVQGSVVESYMITILESVKHFSFAFQELASKRVSSKITSIQGVMLDIHIFEGHHLPCQSAINKNANTCFIPYSSQYPDFDFFLWDSEIRRLRMVQVTIQIPMTSHEPLKQQRIVAWTECLEIKLDQVDILWIVPDQCVPQSGFEVLLLKGGIHSNLVKFSALFDQFPALKKFRPVPPFRQTKCTQRGPQESAKAALSAVDSEKIDASCSRCSEEKGYGKHKPESQGAGRAEASAEAWPPTAAGGSKIDASAADAERAITATEQSASLAIQRGKRRAESEAQGAKTRSRALNDNQERI